MSSKWKWVAVMYDKKNERYVGSFTVQTQRPTSDRNLVEGLAVLQTPAEWKGKVECDVSWQHD